MKQVELILNLERFSKLTGKLIPGSQIELELIKLYRMVQNENSSTIEIFTVMLLKHLFKDNLKHEFSEINIFFKPNVYLHIVNTFLEKLEIYLLHHCSPKIHDIYFKEYRVIDGVKMTVFTVLKD